MIKKFLLTMVLLAIFIIPTSSGSFYVLNTNTNYVETEVGPVPIQHTVGYVLHGDNFYKDFTK